MWTKRRVKRRRQKLCLGRVPLIKQRRLSHASSGACSHVHRDIDDHQQPACQRGLFWRTAPSQRSVGLSPEGVQPVCCHFLLCSHRFPLCNLLSYLSRPQ